MIPDKLTIEERAALLRIARQSLEDGVRGRLLNPLDLSSLPAALQASGASFVTLTRNGELRGCIGALEAHQALADDVREHAIAAALQDYRFPPVTPDELPEIDIEISRLTPSHPLEYDTPQDLIKCLKPNIDGVVLKYGGRRATFLPQVWEKISDPSLFLSYLCQKMGVSPDLWQHKKLEVFIYQVEEFNSKQSPSENRI
jgi:AmmeMemoRadiSam system protein A